MKLSEDEKRVAVGALTVGIAEAERHNNSVVAWRYRNLRKKIETALRNSPKDTDSQPLSSPPDEGEER